MSRFRLSAGGSRAHEPWFRVGTLDVGTTWLAVFASLLGILVYVFGRSQVEQYLIFIPQATSVAHHLWTPLIWPFAVGTDVLGAVIGTFFVWYFGRELETMALGRSKMAWWLLITTLAFAVTLWVVVLAVPSWNEEVLFGGDLIGLAVVLLWTAEWPHRRMVFNIPAWLIGAVYIVIKELQYIHDMRWAMLLTLPISLAVSAFAARQYGALNEYAWIPRLPGGGPRRPRQRARNSAGPTVVAGPWDGTRPTHTPAPPPVNRDAIRMDELLDKISAHGTESLTASERRELEELRLRRRR